MKPELQKLLGMDWHMTGLAGRPAFLTSCCSIDVMQKGLGFSYSTISMAYKEDYCDFWYSARDLSAHASIILKKLGENPKYLEEKREQYNREVAQLEEFFRNAEEQSSRMKDEELFELLLELGPGLETCNGIAHLLESFSLRLEKNIHNALRRKSSGKELNQDFSVIAAPTAQSFLSKKEEVLWEINNAKPEKRRELAERFISDFFWVETNFTGSKRLAVQQVVKEAEKMEKFQKPDFSSLKVEKEGLFKKYGLTEDEKHWIKWTELLVDWQDDRKKNMFRGVFALDKVLHELGRRHKIDVKALHYLLPHEVQEALKSRTAEKIGLERMQGSVFVKGPGKTSVFAGKDFQEFRKSTQKNHNDVDILTGMAASLGTAIGPVKICTTIESIGKVKKGDILVASMTRPEYVPAMKNAAGIVTDEGGITCHAAIVSRELGIPCVVGTKKATKVLKDGDLVEVRANHGMVRKLGS